MDIFSFITNFLLKSDVFSYRKSWYLFYENVQEYLNYFKVFSISTLDKVRYNKLVEKLLNEKK